MNEHMNNNNNEHIFHQNLKKCSPRSEIVIDSLREGIYPIYISTHYDCTNGCISRITHVICRKLHSVQSCGHAL